MRADSTPRVCVDLSEPQEGMKKELTKLEQEVEEQTVKMWEGQMEKLVKLRQELHVLERQMQEKHLQEVSRADVTSQAHANRQLRRLGCDASLDVFRRSKG